jgi:hypothetical protein
MKFRRFYGQLIENNWFIIDNTHSGPKGAEILVDGISGQPIATGRANGR